jgi:sn-glycerol 3-phosphate transport system ATP-binding protein
MALVELSGIGKSFGTTRAVEDVSAGIQDGEFVVILGPSGCGKSTLLRMIAGLETVSEGEIRIAGRKVDHLPPKARGCAMVFQNYALYPHMSVRGNIAYGLRVAGMKRAARERRVAEVAALLELSGLLDRRPGELSGGQRQRVAIARAIAREPRVFLFDEPLSNLDAKLRAAMRTELRKLHDRIGATSIFVTHDQVEAMTLADRIVVLAEGRIVQVGTPQDIYRRPADLFVARFIGTPPMNILEGTAGDGAVALVAGGSVPAPSLPSGTRVSVGIRPEDVAVCDTGLPATVDHVEDLGAHRLLHCLAGGETIVATDGTRRTFRVGEPVRLALDPEAVSLFRADGRRLAPHAVDALAEALTP